VGRLAIVADGVCVCVTTTKQARATIGTSAPAKNVTDSPIRMNCLRISGATSNTGGDEMKTVTLQVARLEEVKGRARDAFKGRKQGPRISFATPELLFRLLTAKRWELIRAMAGAGPMTIREAARRVKRDVKAVHSDVHVPLNAGLLQRTAGLVVFPYEAIHVDVMLHAA
jgi:predicted transcriptional regulator